MIARSISDGPSGTTWYDHVVWFALVLLAAGCGRIAFDGASGGADAAPTTSDPDATAAQLGDALATVQPCSTPLVTETFSNGSLAPEWTVTNDASDPDITASETNDRLVLAFGTPSNSRTGVLVHSAPFDGRGRCITAGVPVIPSDVSGRLEFRVGDGTGSVKVQAGGTVLTGSDDPPSTFPMQRAYDPIQHARWRVQLDSGRVLVLLLDSAGTPTMVLVDVPTFFDEANVTISFAAFVTTGTVSGLTAEIEDVAY